MISDIDGMSLSMCGGVALPEGVPSTFDTGQNVVDVLPSTSWAFQGDHLGGGI